MSNISQTLEWQSTELIDVKAAYDARDYARVVQLLQSTSVDVITENTSLGVMIADSARRVGGVPDVVELINAVVTRARPSEAYCDALNLQGVLLLERGHAQAAERAWCDLVIAATELDSVAHVARASNNLGVAAILDMRLDDAVLSFHRAVSAFMRNGYYRGLAQSHQNLGIAFRELDHLDESHSHFQRAMTFAYAADAMDDVARAEEEMALLFVYTKEDLKTAASLANQALKRFTELQQPAGIAQAMRVVGITALARGSIASAERSLHASLAIASERKLRLLEAETLLALCALAHKKDMRGHSRLLQEQAERTFAEIFVENWGKQVALRMQQL
jgi:hypothetical protein